MIDKDAKDRLRDAFACSFIECDTNRDYRIVMQAMVEIFTALNLSADDVRYISSSADGNCAEADDVIDQLIAIFEE